MLVKEKVFRLILEDVGGLEFCLFVLFSFFFVCVCVNELKTNVPHLENAFQTAAEFDFFGRQQRGARSCAGRLISGQRIFPVINGRL